MLWPLRFHHNCHPLPVCPSHLCFPFPQSVQRVPLQLDWVFFPGNSPRDHSFGSYLQHCKHSFGQHHDTRLLLQDHLRSSYALLFSIYFHLFLLPSLFLKLSPFHCLSRYPRTNLFCESWKVRNFNKFSTKILYGYQILQKEYFPPK